MLPNNSLEATSHPMIAGYCRANNHSCHRLPYSLTFVSDAILASSHVTLAPPYDVPSAPPTDASAAGGHERHHGEAERGDAVPPPTARKGPERRPGAGRGSPVLRARYVGLELALRDPGLLTRN